MKKLFVDLILVFSIASFGFAQNTSTVNTTGNNNTTLTTQTGSNVATINQIKVDWSSATQTQNGTGNIAEIKQETYFWGPGNNSDHNTAAQEQYGQSNNALIWQKPDPNLGHNTAVQYQNGSTNKLIAWQFAVNGEVHQDQIGNNNEAHSYQTGFNGYVKQYQEGMQNIAAVDEQGGGGWVTGNIAMQTQIGNWNKTEISQYGTGGSKTAQGNQAYVDQEGSDNWAGEGLFSNGLFGIYQEGNYNISTVTQNNNVNKSQVFQYGDNNSATVTQNGAPGLFGTYGDYVNKSTVTQTGNNNNGTVTQTY